MTTPSPPELGADADPVFDAIAFAFMDEWEAGDVSGSRPRLDDYVSRYPEYAGRLTDFVLGYVRLQEDGVGDVPYTDALSPEAVRAGARVRETLGLAEYAADAGAEDATDPQRVTENGL